MYKKWKLNEATSQRNDVSAHDQLLTRVMYDETPYTYGTYNDLNNVLLTTNGELTTIDKDEFNDLLNVSVSGESILNLLKQNGVEITVIENTVVEKTGLMALAGTLKEIRSGKISKGSKVLCCLTSGTRSYLKKKYQLGEKNLDFPS